MINQKALDRRIKRHIIAGSHRFFTAIQPGLEEAGVMELTRLGLSPVREKEPGSLCCEGSLEMLWKTALLARSISRLYLRLDSFKTTSFKELKQKFSRIPWELYLREGSVYRIKMTTRHCRLHVDDKITKALNHCLREHFTKLGGTIPVYSDREEKNPAVPTLVMRRWASSFLAHRVISASSFPISISSCISAATSTLSVAMASAGVTIRRRPRSLASLRS